MGDFDARRRDVMLCASALAAVRGIGAARAPAPRTDRARIGRADTVARALHAASPTPALSLAVARPSRVVWAAGYGKADLEFDLAATPAHRFKLGSVSKVLTSTTAARLVSRRM